MAVISIGSTGLTAEQNGFGALPIQRISKEDAVFLLRKAYNGGMRFFDTARAYSDSEEKVGAAFEGMREKVIIATKTGAQKAEDFWKDLETSLSKLKTDYIDIYQFHNPSFIPVPGHESGLYEAIVEAKAQGKIRHIGITNHSLALAGEIIESGLYETIQYPMSYLSTDEELALVKAAEEKGMAFIAMKAMAGGLITHSAAACAYLTRFKNLIPIWGVQRENELDEFLSYIPTPPEMTDEMMAVIEKDRAQLQGDFCRGCGYCMPCPVGIVIPVSARVSLMLRRAPLAISINDETKEQMQRVENCIECGQCAAKCPYHLNTPELLKRNYKDYMEVLAGKPL